MMPTIPPDSAFSVDGQVDPRVVATLAEARRIRDHHAEVLEAARIDAISQGRARVRRAIHALHRWAERERVRSVESARTLALELAIRVVRDVRADSIDALVAQARDSTANRLEQIVLRLAPADAAGVTAPVGVRIIEDPGLERGDLVVEDPNGAIDSRVRSMLLRTQ